MSIFQNPEPPADLARFSCHTPLFKWLQRSTFSGRRPPLLQLWVRPCVGLNNGCLCFWTSPETKGLLVGARRSHRHVCYFFYKCENIVSGHENPWNTLTGYLRCVCCASSIIHLKIALWNLWSSSGEKSMYMIYRSYILVWSCSSFKIVYRKQIQWIMVYYRLSALTLFIHSRHVIGFQCVWEMWISEDVTSPCVCIYFLSETDPSLPDDRKKSHCNYEWWFDSVEASFLLHKSLTKLLYPVQLAICGYCFIYL